MMGCVLGGGLRYGIGEFVLVDRWDTVLNYTVFIVDDSVKMLL